MEISQMIFGWLSRALILTSVLAVFGVGASASIASECAPAQKNAVWFGGCAFEMDRYVSCRIADPKVESWLKSRVRVNQGVALEEYMKVVFEENGCVYGPKDNAFGANGVFLSFDSAKLEDISCAGKSSKMRFSPKGMTALDTVYFFFETPTNPDGDLSAEMCR
jgi:hypothetical protein